MIVWRTEQLFREKNIEIMEGKLSEETKWPLIILIYFRKKV